MNTFCVIKVQKFRNHDKFDEYLPILLMINVFFKMFQSCTFLCFQIGKSSKQIIIMFYFIFCHMFCFYTVQLNRTPLWNPYLLFYRKLLYFVVRFTNQPERMDIRYAGPFGLCFEMMSVLTFKKYFLVYIGVH